MNGLNKSMGVKIKRHKHIVEADGKGGQLLIQEEESEVVLLGS